MEYEGILFFGQNVEFAGRGIAGPRLRTAASKNGFNILVTDILNDITVDMIYDILECNITKKTKFVGFSYSWIEVNNLKKYQWYNQVFFETIKNKWPHLLIITGGHDNFKKDLLLKNSDYHFQGYSDKSFIEFLKLINNLPNNLIFQKSIVGKGFVINSNLNHQILNPDELETIFLKEDNFKSYQPLPIEIARGCIFRCSFCRHPFQGKKNYDDYQRTSENIAIELKRNYDLFGTTRYTILDDTFNDSIEKIKKVAKAIEISKIPKFEFVSYIKPELLVTKPEMIDLLVDIGLRGAFIGFESFNNKSRKIIGKGTDIEKVLDSCKKISSIKNQVLIHGGFIVGLPHDTIENIEKTFIFLKSSENDFIKSWYFQALNVYRHSKNNSTESLFDKNSSDLGFKFHSDSLWSRDDGWNFKMATQMATRLNTESETYNKIGGWRVAGCWHLGIDDINLNKNLKMNQFIQNLKNQSINRAYSEYNNLIKK